MKIVLVIVAVFCVAVQAETTCFSNCKTCDNAITCTKCEDGYALSKDKKSCLADTCEHVVSHAKGVRDVCQEFRLTIHDAINDQINEELIASYVYQDMAQFFDRADVAYRGFSKFFKKCAEEEREHAQKFIDYINKRGGTVTLKPIQAPEWEKERIGTTGISITNSPLHAVSKALEKERYVNGKLLELHKLARTWKDDPQFQDFLESEYLGEQVEAAKQLSDWKTILKRMENEPVGVMVFDQELLDGKR